MSLNTDDSNEIFETLIKSGDVLGLRNILSDQENRNKLGNWRGKSPIRNILHETINYFNVLLRTSSHVKSMYEVLEFLLETYPELINDGDYFGRTPVHYATFIQLNSPSDCYKIINLMIRYCREPELKISESDMGSRWGGDQYAKYILDTIQYGGVATKDARK